MDRAERDLIVFALFEAVHDAFPSKEKADALVGMRYIGWLLTLPEADPRFDWSGYSPPPGVKDTVWARLDETDANLNVLRPGLDREVVLQRVGAMVSEHTFTIMATVINGRRVAYTIGLTQKGQPEVVLIGLPIALAQQMLNRLGHQVVNHGEELTPGVRLDLRDNGPMQLVWVDDQSPLTVLTAMYGARARVLQLVWPDKTGAWPWDAVYSAAELQPAWGKP